MPDNTHPEVNRFSDWFAKHRNGAADAEAGHKLTQAVMAAGMTDKAATVTLKITIKPEGEAFIVIDEQAAKLPEPKEAKIYYADRAGNLTRRNPSQPALEGMEP